MKKKKLSLAELLKALWQEKASNLIITVGVPPMLKKFNTLKPIGDTPLTPVQAEQLILSVLNEHQKKQFEKGQELNFSFGIKGMARFLATIFIQRGVPNAVFRIIPFRIPTWEELGGPGDVLPFLNRTCGLCIITGKPGSGKTTVMASLIDYINNHRPAYIITIEEPIEYIYHHKKSVIIQRQIGYDTESFESAIQYIDQTGVDVVALSAVYDRKRLEYALDIAQRCCLCIILLHSVDIIRCLRDIVTRFPTSEQSYIKTRLADSLIFALCPGIIEGTKKRHIQYEVLINDQRIEPLLRNGEFEKLKSYLKRTSRGSKRKR